MTMAVAEIAPAQAVNPEQRTAILRSLRRLPTSTDGVTASDMDARALTCLVVAAFRAHGHICNVMTHISGARWDLVEEAVCAILDPRTGQKALTPLAENIVDLLCADRGVTGRIVKPHFNSLLAGILPSDVAARLCAHVACLFSEEMSRAESARGRAL